MIFIFHQVGDGSAGWRAWAPVISAAATTIAVLVALFGELFRQYLLRPKLRLRAFDAAQADGVEFRHPRRGLEQAYVRLRVENRGRATARMVEVTIERVEPLDGIDEDPERDQQFKRQELQGSVGNRLQWADRHCATLDIPAGTSRRVDLIYLSTDEPKYRIEGTLDLALPMRLMLEKRSSGNEAKEVIEGMERHVLPQLGYRVCLTIAGSNVKPSAYWVDLQFGGVWLEGREIWNAENGGIVVSEPQSIKPGWRGRGLRHTPVPGLAA
jgi:hypothetical protein